MWRDIFLSLYLLKSVCAGKSFYHERHYHVFKDLKCVIVAAGSSLQPWVHRLVTVVTGNMVLVPGESVPTCPAVERHRTVTDRGETDSLHFHFSCPEGTNVSEMANKSTQAHNLCVKAAVKGLEQRSLCFLFPGSSPCLLEVDRVLWLSTALLDPFYTASTSPPLLPGCRPGRASLWRSQAAWQDACHTTQVSYCCF